MGIIFLFMGNLSIGKLIVVVLVVLIVGNFIKGSNILFRSWNGIRNVFEGYLSSNFGVFIVLDELLVVIFKDIIGLLYSLVEG